MPQHSYTAYGLSIRSELALPGLMPGPDHGEPDITIRFGDTPETLPYPSDMGVLWESGPTEHLLSVAGVARYFLRDRNEIIITEEAGGRTDEVSLFLLGSVLAALLSARQIAILHASAVVTERGAVAFVGRSGAGKSTLLAAMLQRGYKMLTDDKACLAVNAAGVTEVLPAFPMMRLTPGSVEALGYPLAGTCIQQNLNKYPLLVEHFHNSAVPLRAVYALGTHNQADIRLERVAGIEQFETLRHNLYRRRFIVGTLQRQAVFRTLSAAARQAPVIRVTRPEYPCRIDELVAAVEADLENCEAAPDMQSLG